MKANKKMNTYHISFNDEPNSVIYYCIAKDVDHVKSLANEFSIDISDCVIELHKLNIRDELGRSYKPVIRKSIV